MAQQHKGFRATPTAPAGVKFDNHAKMFRAFLMQQSIITGKQMIGIIGFVMRKNGNVVTNEEVWHALREEAAKIDITKVDQIATVSLRGIFPEYAAWFLKHGISKADYKKLMLLFPKKQRGTIKRTK